MRNFIFLSLISLKLLTLSPECHASDLLPPTTEGDKVNDPLNRIHFQDNFEDEYPFQSASRLDIVPRSNHPLNTRGTTFYDPETSDRK